MAAQSEHPSSKIGIIGLILSTLGCIISSGSLLLMVFIWGMGGGLDILDYPSEELIFIMYAGLLLGVVGGILGMVSLTRGESRTASGISIILGAIILGVGVLLTILIIGPNAF